VALLLPLFCNLFTALTGCKRDTVQVHFVHYNTQYADLDEALPNGDGVAVLGVFAQVTSVYKNECHCRSLLCTQITIGLYVKPKSSSSSSSSSSHPLKLQCSKFATRIVTGKRESEAPSSGFFLASFISLNWVLYRNC